MTLHHTASEPLDRSSPRTGSLFVSLNKILVLFLELFITEQVVKDTHGTPPFTQHQRRGDLVKTHRNSFGHAEDKELSSWIDLLSLHPVAAAVGLIPQDTVYQIQALINPCHASSDPIF